MSDQAPRSTSTHDLVAFARPPVAEVALSVQMEPETVGLEALGLFAHRVRADLPVRQNQPVAPPMSETFDQAGVAPSFEIRLESPADVPRVWFASKDGVQLVQLQHDRLVLNWREVGEGRPYPRYRQLRARFEALLGALEECLVQGGGSPTYNITEVTYVNPVDSGEVQGRGHPDLALIVNRLRTRPPDAFLPESEDAQLQARWRIPGSELGSKMPAGRLYLSAVPGLKPPKYSPIYMVNLTGRVIPSSGHRSSAMEALDVGHKWVVLGFKDLTTSEMHRRWGLESP